MNSNETPKERVEATELSVRLNEVDYALKENGLVHNMASSISDNYEGLQEVAELTGSDYGEAQDIAEFSMMAEDDQFADAIAKSLFTMLVEALGESEVVTFTQAMEELSQIPKAQTLIRKNPRFAEKALEILSHAFAEAIRTEQRDGLIPDLDDPLTRSITNDLRDLLKQRFRE